MSESKPVLDKDQRTQLATHMIGSQRNIYYESERLFGITIDEATWELMDKEHKIFLCEGCSFFMNSTEQVKGITGYCRECVEKHF